MYEFSLANSVNDTVLKLCRESGWSRVRRIMIKVGGMRKVDPERMAFIFAGLSKNTPAEGAILSVMILPVTLFCYSCGHTGNREDSQFLCPLCGSRNVRLISGLERDIEMIEVESESL